MKHKKFFLAATLTLAMVSCGSNKNENAVSENNSHETEIEAVAEGQDVADSPQVSAQENQESQSYILTKDGLGPFTLGMKKSEIPSSIPGLYDSKNYSTFNHDENMDIPPHLHGYMTFSLKGEPQFSITFDNSGKAVQISVHSSAIPTSLGITTASPVEKAAALPGAKPTDGFIDGYEVQGFTIYALDEITSIAIGEQY